jgi:hypothetical protein
MEVESITVGGRSFSISASTTNLREVASVLILIVFSHDNNARSTKQLKTSFFIIQSYTPKTIRFVNCLKVDKTKPLQNRGVSI